jgi:hypothetical protein
VDAGNRQIDPQRKEHPHAKIGRQIENAILRMSRVIVHANRLTVRILVPQGRSREWAVASRNPRVWCELTESNAIVGVRLSLDVVAVAHKRVDDVVTVPVDSGDHDSGIKDLALDRRPSPSEPRLAELDDGVATGQSSHGENSEVREWQCNDVVQKYPH